MDLVKCTAQLYISSLHLLYFLSSVLSNKLPISISYKHITDFVFAVRPSHLVPSSIAGGIKILYPMFRGYTQQDTQEFLRCFMDQLHEELKQPIIAGNTDEGETDGEVEIVNTNENCCNIEAERYLGYELIMKKECFTLGFPIKWV